MHWPCIGHAWNLSWHCQWQSTEMTEINVCYSSMTSFFPPIRVHRCVAWCPFDHRASFTYSKGTAAPSQTGGGVMAIMKDMEGRPQVLSWVYLIINTGLVQFCRRWLLQWRQNAWLEALQPLCLDPLSSQMCTHMSLQTNYGIHSFLQESKQAPFHALLQQRHFPWTRCYCYGVCGSTHATHSVAVFSCDRSIWRLMKIWVQIINHRFILVWPHLQVVGLRAIMPCILISIDYFTRIQEFRAVFQK